MSRIILVRHGQASWDSEHYDELTPLGHEQARAVGGELAARGVEPDLLVHGSLSRQRDTMTSLAAAAGWGQPLEQDARWDELDADGIIRSHAPQHATMTAALAAARREGDARDFDRTFGAAMLAWFAGESVDAEPFAAFRARTRAALDDLVARLDREVGARGTAVVVTSGGVCNSLCAELLGGDTGTVEVWMRLFGAFRNTAITRLGTREGHLHVLSLGEISHLERQPHLLTDR